MAAAHEERFARPELPAAAREELLQVVGESNLHILFALDGYEHSADCAWQLDTVGKFADTMFSDELGPDAPYSIIAWSGGGDAWALDRRNAQVTFLNHDGWVGAGEHEMEVPMKVDLVTFISIAEAWVLTEALIDEDEDCEVTAIEAFLTHLRGINEIAADRWPYC